MLSVLRQTLRLGARSACVRYSARNRFHEAVRAPLIGVVAHRRHVHEDRGAGDRQVLGKLEGKMKLMFTCKKCKTRNSKLISKLAYSKGVVIVRCDGCKNNHLIADNLGWFSEGIHRGINIERLMALKGETVRKVSNDMDGYFEAVTREEFESSNSGHSDTTKDVNPDNDQPAKIERSAGAPKES